MRNTAVSNARAAERASKSPRPGAERSLEGLSRDELVKTYRTMLLSRRIDDKIDEIGSDRAELRWDENGIQYRIVLRKEDGEWRIDDIHIRPAEPKEEGGGETPAIDF